MNLAGQQRPNSDKYVMLILSGLLVIFAVISLHVGVRQYGIGEVWFALFGGGDDSTSLIIRTLRLPRMITAPLVGAALGIAGLLLQTATRNPLASPALLGVNAGAAFAAVLAVSVFGITALLPLSIAACVGALIATALVFFLSVSAGGAFTPTNTLLAGVTLAALLASGTQIVLVTDESTMESLLFWLSGGFADRGLELLVISGPIIAFCSLAAFAMNGHLDILLTDDASAQAIGVPVARIRLSALVLSALLTGACVILAGPVAFIGLVAPHLARRLGGLDHRIIIPLVALLGANLALASDILARFIIYPSEAPISAVLAFIGVPVLVVLLQSRTLTGPQK